MRPLTERNWDQPVYFDELPQDPAKYDFVSDSFREVLDKCRTPETGHSIIWASANGWMELVANPDLVLFLDSVHHPEKFEDLSRGYIGTYRGVCVVTSAFSQIPEEPPYNFYLLLRNLPGRYRHRN